MADFTPVAGGIQAPDATKTLSSLAQFQMAQAHSGLYQLQSQQLGMKINALQAYGSAKAAGDPNAIAHVMAIDPEMGKNILGAEEAQRSMRMRQLGAAATYINGLDARDRPQAEIQTWNDLAHRGLIDPMTYAMWKDRMGTNDP